MTNRERVEAVLAGRPVDRFPVTSLYNMLYHDDHFTELTGLPAWRLQEWQAMPPDRHVEVFRQIHQQVPLETLQPQGCPSRAQRERTEFVVRDGQPFRHDRRADTWTPVTAATRSGHASDYMANETPQVVTIADIDQKLRPARVEDLLANGHQDYIQAIVAAFPDEFVIAGGVIGTIYGCGQWVGQTNLLAMLIEQPAFVEHLCRRLVEQNLAQINFLAAAGGDAIYIDDATATCDMISVAHYERFSLPYMQEMVREIQRLGKRAIVIYFGGVADRLEQLAAIGADAIQVEATMKGYVNDLAVIAERLGQRVTLFGNLNPLQDVQDAREAELAAEMRRQIVAGTKVRGFLVSTGSPLTPGTPKARVQRFLALGKELSADVLAGQRGASGANHA